MVHRRRDVADGAQVAARLVARGVVGARGSGGGVLVDLDAQCRELSREEVGHLRTYVGGHRW